MPEMLQPGVLRATETHEFKQVGVTSRPRSGHRTPAWNEHTDRTLRLRLLEHQVQILGDAVRLLASATDEVDHDYARDHIRQMLLDIDLSPTDED